MQKLIQFLTRRRCKSYCQFGQKLPPPYKQRLRTNTGTWLGCVVVEQPIFKEK
nr:MAG TPA: hypothetical protein [Caudoviricetes sp.]